MTVSSIVLLAHGLGFGVSVYARSIGNKTDVTFSITDNGNRIYNVEPSSGLRVKWKVDAFGVHHYLLGLRIRDDGSAGCVFVFAYLYVLVLLSH